MQRATALLLLVVCVAGTAIRFATAEPAPRALRITDNAGKEPKAPTSCGDNKEKDDCLDLGAQEGDCAWCAGDYMPGSCVGIDAAKWIPETVAKCKLPKTHEQVQQVAAAGKDDASKDKPKAPTSCGDNKDKHDCLHLGAQEGDCAWCEGDYMPASCMSASAAKYLPETVAKCKLPKEHKKVAAPAVNKDKPTAPTSCGDNKDKHDCLHLGAQEGDCAWCEGDYMPASCMSASAAKYLPETVAKCKLPKEHKKVVAAEAANKHKPKAPTSCGDNKEKYDCLDLGAEEGECAWCEGGYMPGSCVGVNAAKWIPEFVAKCKLPKKHDDDDDDDEDDDDIDDDDDDDVPFPLKKSSGSGGDWPSGGGDWPSGGGDWPSGGGDSPSGGGDWPSGGGDWPSGGGDSPSGGGSGAGGGCKDKKSKRKCLRDSSCAWCKKGFIADGCTDAMTVKYLPKFVANCKLGKDDKRGSVATS